MAEANLEQLKQKYNSALTLMPQLGIVLSHVHIQGGKLFVQGEAPSETAKNRVWDEIKRVDSSYSDLTADITVNSSLPDPAKNAGAMASGSGGSVGGGLQTYTVKSGDTLSKIAKQYYGNANQYNRIFEANREQLTDPDQIKPGQVLKIPV